MTMAVFEAAIEPLLDHVQIELLSECLGAAELYEMYEELRPSARRLLADMERALDFSDLNEAKRSAHALKGVASSFGALRLSQLAKIVELHCRSLPEAGSPPCAQLTIHAAQGPEPTAPQVALKDSLQSTRPSPRPLEASGNRS